jgi:transposase
MGSPNSRPSPTQPRQPGCGTCRRLVTRRRVWIQQFSAPDGPVRWRTNDDLPPAALLIQAPHDVEARSGIKRTTTWTGDQVQLTETGEAEQPHLITNVETTDATVPATERLDPIHAHLAARDLLPGEHLVDAG